VNGGPSALAVCPDAIDPITSRVQNIEINGVPLTVFKGTPDRAELIRRLQGFRGALTSESCVDEHVLAACPDLKVIVFLGTGASTYIDVEACRRREVTVRTVAGYGNRVVAEHAAALMFTVYRDLPTQHVAMLAGGWDEGRPIGELHGKTLGVVGMGGVGAEMCQIGRALGMKVIGWRAADNRDSEMELDALLSTADVVSVHLALNEDTRSFLNRDRLRRMKRGAVLINTARGALVDEAELGAMLADGHLSGAGLDVYSSEPLPADHPLRMAPHVVLSCHTAWRSPEAVERLVRTGLAHLAEELGR
jgi:D-3-phosphoglycerate dehydrogenase